MIKRRNLLWLSALIAGAGLLGLLEALTATPAAAAPTKAMLLITTSSDGELSPCG